MDARIQAGSPRPLVLPHLDNFVIDPNTRSGFRGLPELWHSQTRAD